MQISVIFLSLVATGAAMPQFLAAAARSVQPWVAPGPSDSRSPCPMLNTLANHGYLPHSGKNLTVQDIAEACQTALNFDVGFGLQLGAAAFQLLGGKETIDLEDLNTAGATEHRASLTRDDAGEGRDTLRVNPDRLRAMLDDSDDPDYLTVASLAKTRLRVEAASGLPPLEGHGLTMALGESGLLLLGMADGPISAPIDSAALRAPKDRVSAWFLTEELPVELGWQPASRVLTIADVAALSQAVVAAQIGLAGLTN